jgi:hypothetical protein
MKYGGLCALALAIGLVILAPAPAVAHHEILAKFDQNKTMTLRGIVTLVDWKNPHVHLFMNVQEGNRTVRWAVELESPIDLGQNGWTAKSVQIGEALTVEGIAARDGTFQIWGNSVAMTSTGRRILDVASGPLPAPKQTRPTPRWPDGQPRLGPAPGGSGYWAHPSATSLMENGVNVPVSAHGLLRNIADVDKVAPFQKWARDLYELRQRNFLKDDPLFLHCKPPGGPRQYQVSHGVQFVENREFKRIFVLMGGGNRNFRIIYTDGRENIGQIDGDDTNPLYYGRSVGKWEGDSLVLDTTGFNEKFWFSNGGLPHTEHLKMVERFTRTDFDTLRYEVTINDPGAYTRPWTASWTLRWVAGEELPAHFCQENRP